MLARLFLGHFAFQDNSVHFPVEQEVPLYVHFDVLFVFHLSVSACHTNVSECRMAGEVVISLVQFPFFLTWFLATKIR